MTRKTSYLGQPARNKYQHHFWRFTSSLITFVEIPCQMIQRVLLFQAGIFALCYAQSICNSSDVPFVKDELAVACYGGNFLVKMLSELNSGNAKTVNHVRVHLLPYMGGIPTLNDLRKDNPDDPECSVCYTDVNAAQGEQETEDIVTLVNDIMLDNYMLGR
jgi:hypothetical protein